MIVGMEETATELETVENVTGATGASTGTDEEAEGEAEEEGESELVSMKTLT